MVSLKGSKAFFLSRLVCSLSTAHCNALVPTTTSSSPLAQQQDGSQLISAQIRPLAEPAGHCLDLHLMLRHASMPLQVLFVNRTGWAGSSPVVTHKCSHFLSTTILPSPVPSIVHACAPSSTRVQQPEPVLETMWPHTVQHTNKERRYM